MRTLRVTWLLALSLAAIGSLCAHALAHALVAPHSHAAPSLGRAMAGGFWAEAPAFAVLLAGALLALVPHALASRRGEGRARFARWPFVAVPFLVYSLQEHLERLFHASAAHPLAGASTLLVALLLQVPFALLALVLASALLNAAEKLGKALADEPWWHRRRAPAGRRRPSDFRALRLLALARGYAERGPPPLLA